MTLSVEQQTAGYADLAAGVEAERHLDLDDVLVAPGRLGVEGDDDFIEARCADLLLPFASPC